MKRSDNGNFVMVSLWVKNLMTSNKTMTVEGRLGASTVKELHRGGEHRVQTYFASATIDQVRIVCAVDDTWSYAGVFDTFTFDAERGADRGEFRRRHLHLHQGRRRGEARQGTAATRPTTVTAANRRRTCSA